TPNQTSANVATIPAIAVSTRQLDLLGPASQASPGASRGSGSLRRVLERVLRFVWAVSTPVNSSHTERPSRRPGPPEARERGRLPRVDRLGAPPRTVLGWQSGRA